MWSLCCACVSLSLMAAHSVYPVFGSSALRRWRSSSARACCSLLVFAACCVGLVSDADAQSFTVAPGLSLSPTSTSFGSAARSVGGLLEQVIGNTMAGAGQGAAQLQAAGGLDAVVAATETGLADAAAAAGGAAAVGSPATWAAVGAFAAGAAIAGTAVCYVQGCDVSQTFNQAMQSIWGLFGTTFVPPGSILYAGGFNGAPIFVGTNPNSLTNNICNSFPLTGTFAGYQLTGSSTSVQVVNVAYQANCTITKNGTSFVESAPIGKTTNYTIPPAGLQGGPSFNVGNASSGQLSDAESAPPPGVPTNIFKQTIGGFSPSQQAEPASPDLIAGMANNMRSQMANSSDPGTAAVGKAMPNITGGMVATTEAETGFFPTLADLFNPVAQNSVVVSGGTVNPTPNPGLIANAPTTMPTDSTIQKNASPCGNVLAGQPPCDEILDFNWNPRTGSWEWDGGGGNGPNQNSGRNLPSVPNTSSLQQTQKEAATESQTLPDSRSKTDTTTQVDTWTDPRTAIKTLQPTWQPQTVIQDQTVTTPPGLPPMSLPFNEWPDVINDFNTSVPLLGPGVCPTVQFTSTTLNNTTFTFAAQCLVMDAMKPYLQYVLPPTYLLLGLLFLMGA